MRVNVCSRSLAAFVFLAIIAISHAVAFWVPVWKQTTVLRYHPKKGWYPVKHGGTGSSFKVKSKKWRPPLENLLKKARQHLAISHQTQTIVHDAPIPPPPSPANILHHPKYRGWKRPRSKPIHKPIHHHPPPPPPPPIHDHDHDHDYHGPGPGPSSWNPSKPFSGQKPRPRPRRPTKLKPKRRPRPQNRPKPVPSFNLDFPSPFGQRPFEQHDFLPKPNRPSRPYGARTRGKVFNKYNPFHKIISSHFAPNSPSHSVKIVKNKPKNTRPILLKSPKYPLKQYHSSVRIRRPVPVKQILSRPKKLPKSHPFKGFSFPRVRGRQKSPRVPIRIPKVKDFLTHNEGGSFNFNNFPNLNNPVEAPKVNTYFSSFMNDNGIDEVFKINNSPKGPGPDFLTNHGDGGFSFQTFPQMNSPPSAEVPQIDSNFFTLGNFGSLVNEDVSESSPKPYDSPRVPRTRSRLPLFSYNRNNHYKISNSPKSKSPPQRSPPTTDHDYYGGHDHRGHSPPDDDLYSSNENNSGSSEEYPKHSHLQNSGVRHSPPRAYSSPHFGGGFRGGFGRSSGFSTGARGQGWGDWVW